MGYYHPIPEKSFVIDRVLKGIADAVAVAMFVLFLCIECASVEKIEGNSMSGVLEDGDVILVNRMAYDLSEPERYEILAFEKNGETFIKRVVGIPGDTVEIIDGHLFLNGEAVLYNSEAEGMIHEGICEDGPVTLGEKEYFVLGDNWNVSEDSRSPSIGKIYKDELIGKVWMRVAPFVNAGPIDTEPKDGAAENPSAPAEE